MSGEDVIAPLPTAMPRDQELANQQVSHNESAEIVANTAGLVAATTAAGPVAAAPSPASPVGIPDPLVDYKGRVPWNRLWGKRTLEGKVNKQDMIDFLKLCGVSSASYTNVINDTLYELVMQQQILNRDAKLATKSASSGQTSSAQSKKRKASGGEDKETESRASKKAKKNPLPAMKAKSAKQESIASAPVTNSAKQAQDEAQSSSSAPNSASPPKVSPEIRRAYHASNLSTVAASLIHVKKLARSEIFKEIEDRGYMFDLDYSSNTAPQDERSLDVEGYVSDVEMEDAEQDLFSSHLSTIPIVIDHTKGKPALFPEAQYRVREAIRVKYATRALRDDGFEEVDEKKVKQFMLSGRKNWKELIRATTVSIKGTDIANKDDVAKVLLRRVLGDDVDGEWDMGAEKTAYEERMAEQEEEEEVKSSGEEEDTVEIAKAGVDKNVAAGGDEE
ncbi:hypothetical protein BDV96DRAFT_640998 [Lophiotrema nucula]|uniref:Uncharacterized protein n=1 Tax=Lophiotrema nucula TaxID=690887 RepID=A0A6A5ZRL3_9PLEO|nr:hypothetical protein BDV96DRAFT_640998 [Lophiotrema nucula]